MDDVIPMLLYHQLVTTELRSLMMNSVMMKSQESGEECDEDESNHESAGEPDDEES